MASVVGKFRILAIIAATLVAALYAFGSWSNQFVYDDHEVIENQYAIRSFADLAQIFREPHYLDFPYYRPITRSTFALQKMIWGNSPLPYHLFNALLAGGVMLAAYGLLRRPALATPPLAALLAAVWFAVHPAMSECVYPAASGRESLMPMLMILLATWAFFGKGDRNYWLAMLFLAVSLLCKEQAAVVPAIFLAADFLELTSWSQHRHRWNDWGLRYLPIVILFCIYFWIRHLIFNGPTLHFATGDHLWGPLSAIGYGIQTTITPFPDLRYEPTLAVWRDPALFAVACGIAALLAIAAVFAGKTARRVALFWLGWFVLVQLPTAHILQQEAPYSERYVALAVFSFAAILGCVASNWRPLLAKTSAICAAIVWIAALGWISFQREACYASDTTFALQWYTTNPYSASAHNGLALEAQLKGQWQTAIDQYTQALQLDPDSSTAHNNLANLLSEHGKYYEAESHYQWILKRNPNDVSVLVNYARLLSNVAVKRNSTALRDRAHNLLNLALRLRPRDPRVHFELGEWNQAFDTPAAALSEFKEALRLDPGSNDAKRRIERLESTSTRSSR